jgi:hypothetical protein
MVMAMETVTVEAITMVMVMATPATTTTIIIAGADTGATLTGGMDTVAIPGGVDMVIQ